MTLRQFAIAAVGLLLGACSSEGGSCLLNCPAETVNVTPTTQTLTEIGETLQLSATVFDVNNARVTDPSLSWSSSDPAVASVSSSGLVTAVTNGSVTISAAVGSKSGTAAVTVAQTPSSVDLDPDTARLAGPGDTETFVLDVSDGGGTVLNEYTAAWASSDPAVATVDASGVVTAVSEGIAQVDVMVTAGGASTSETGVVLVYAGLQITVSPLAQGVIGAAYSETLQATGGDGSYTWGTTGGSLPTGLTLAPSTGVISGTPTVAGGYTFTIQVTSGDGQTASTTMSIDVFASFTITTTSLTDGAVGAAYDVTLTVGGGSGTLTWSVSSGTLPDGLTLDAAAGTITGTPTIAGTSDFTILVSSSDGGSDSQALSIDIVEPLAVSTSSLPNGGVGAAYAQTLQTTGGSGAITWAVTTGSLPDGLSLGASTGMISGTPTTAATSNFTVEASDQIGETDAAALAITIDAALQVTTTVLPRGMATVDYGVGSLVASGGDGSFTWALEAGSGPLPSGLTLNTDGTVTGTPSTAGSASFTVEVTSGYGQIATQSLSIDVIAAAYLFVARCRDYQSNDVACRLQWLGTTPDTIDVSISGDTISLPPNDTVTAEAYPPDSVFLTFAEIGGDAGFQGEIVFDLTGQGGELCGGSAESLALVTVTPNSGCPGAGVVSSAQEAVYLVQDGGTIEFTDGDHAAMRIPVPRDDLTLQAAAAQSPVILAGTGDPTGYDGPAFVLLGAGSLTVQDLIFRSPGTGNGGIGFVTGPNSIEAAGAYTSVLVDNVTFEDLRLSAVVLPSSVPNATVTVQNSMFRRTVDKTPQTRGIFVFANDIAGPDLTVTGTTFESVASDPIIGIVGLNTGPTLFDQPVSVDIQGNFFIGCETCIGLGLGLEDGSIVSGNDFSDPIGVASAIRVAVLDGGDEVTIADNVITGAFLGGDASDLANYTFEVGIRVAGPGGALATLDANDISGAFYGIQHVESVDLFATDQVIDVVYTPVVSENAPLVTIEMSDLTNFLVPYEVASGDPFADGSLICNWWGDAAGPGGESSVHTPWADGAVANGAGGGCTPPGSADVTVNDNYFEPMSVTLAAGSTVTWTWAGSNMHSVIFADHVDDSGTQDMGTHQRTFASPGTYEYECGVHGPAMSGTVVVQ